MNGLSKTLCHMTPIPEHAVPLIHSVLELYAHLRVTPDLGQATHLVNVHPDHYEITIQHLPVEGPLRQATFNIDRNQNFHMISSLALYYAMIKWDLWLS
jgi:hypothetical protein